MITVSFNLIYKLQKKKEEKQNYLWRIKNIYEFPKNNATLSQNVIGYLKHFLEIQFEICKLSKKNSNLGLLKKKIEIDFCC